MSRSACSFVRWCQTPAWGWTAPTAERGRPASPRPRLFGLGDEKWHFSLVLIAILLLGETIYQLMYLRNSASSLGVLLCFTDFCNRKCRFVSKGRERASRTCSPLLVSSLWGYAVFWWTTRAKSRLWFLYLESWTGPCFCLFLFIF